MTITSGTPWGSVNKTLVAWLQRGKQVHNVCLALTRRQPFVSYSSASEFNMVKAQFRCQLRMPKQSNKWGMFLKVKRFPCPKQHAMFLQY